MANRSSPAACAPGRALGAGSAAYGLLDLVGAIWPYNVAAAAGPLAAAILGHLPGSGSMTLMGHELTESTFVRLLGIIIFVLAFVPLIFGGTIYRMLEKVMTLKLILILGYLTLVTAFLVSPHNIWEVASGFVEFGTYAERAETIIVDPHFHFTLVDNADRLLVKGTMENGSVMIGQYQINGVTQSNKLPPDENARRDAIVAKAVAQLRPGQFFVETQPEEGAVLSLSGRVDHGKWIAQRFCGHRCRRRPHSFDRLEDVPAEICFAAGRPFEEPGLGKAEPGQICRRAQAASRYRLVHAGRLHRDRRRRRFVEHHVLQLHPRKRLGHGGPRRRDSQRAVGGRKIKLSHVGSVFLLDKDSLRRWHGWLRHVFRDQVFVWMLASFIGMALPCMVSMEFIRNATVASDRVAAMTAEGISQRYPEHRQMLWTVTLLCGFLVLVPGQISVGDQISRRWTDIIWMSNPRAQRLAGNQVKYVYYSILSMYAVLGFTMLCLFPALAIAKFAAGIANVSLAVSSLQALFANRTLMPKPLQPHWLLQTGVVCSAIFFLGISGVVLYDLLR